MSLPMHTELKMLTSNYLIINDKVSNVIFFSYINFLVKKFNVLKKSNAFFFGWESTLIDHHFVWRCILPNIHLCMENMSGLFFAF